jgi:hypothetical protein
MKTAILKTLEYSKNLIISPDMDGFISAKLLERYNGSKVVGTYDKNILCLSDDVTIEDCLFVDCDMNNSSYISIGNHMRLLDDNMSSKSFNPNVHFGVTTYTDKFPYATAFLISFATEVPTSNSDHIRMAYADSTLKNMLNYSDNMLSWSKRMSHDPVSYVIWNTEELHNIDDEFREIYPNQSFTSKRYGKTRYMQSLNDAFIAEEILHEPLSTGIKLMSDKVGLNTVVRYNKDIVSYAEVFGGEYSVTYDQEVDWK